jgi:hypothetical protein
MHNAPDTDRPSPPTPTPAPRRPGAPPGAPPGRGRALLAAVARTVRRVMPAPLVAAGEHAESSADDETAMHSPCL